MGIFFSDKQFAYKFSSGYLRNGKWNNSNSKTTTNVPQTLYIQCATNSPLTTPTSTAVFPTTKGESGSGGAAYLDTNKLA